MTSLTRGPPVIQFAKPNHYGNPYSQQDAYGTQRHGANEYMPQVPGQHSNSSAKRQGLYSPRTPKHMTDPNGYHDPGSYSDQVNGPTSYQDSKPYVPTLQDYATHGFYENPEIERQKLIRQRQGRASEMSHPLYNELVRKDDKLNDTTMSGNMAYGDPADLERRYGITPAASTSERVAWNGYNANLFNVTPKLGPVKQMFFSRENIRRLGDYFDSRGLGRPSAENMREYMQLVWADNPDFLFDWRRDTNSAKMQLQRLNSLLIADMVPILESARDGWKKYQYDAYFGWGWQLIDNPVNTSTKRNANSLEFNNRMF